VTSDDRSYRSISRGFAELVQLLAIDPQHTFDVVVVGSGYGAAAAAFTFATSRTPQGDPVSVCVLERGKEYLPGMFPARFAELPRHLRYKLPSGSRNNEGLFDIRFSSSVTTVVANGVGGGSLINAGVMERAAPGVFQKGWPVSLNAVALQPYYDRAETLLGTQPFDAGRPEADLPAKFRVFRNLDSAHHRPALITVAQHDGGVASGGFEMSRCIECGDCATGCNHNAKISLDVSLLGRAARQPRCAVYTGATVLNLSRANGRWNVNCVHTDENLRKRQGATVPVHARHVVLAAGTLGTVEILKRSAAVPVSARLGDRASTNGDMMVVDFDTRERVNAVADESQAPALRQVGPTITGVIDWRDVPGKPAVVIEEMAIPGPLRRLFRDLFATVNALHGMADRDCTWHQRGFPYDDLYAVDDRPIGRTGVYAIMGDDQVEGATVHARVEVPQDADADYVDGVAVLASDDVGGIGLFRQQLDGIEALTKSTQGRIIPNPLWQLLPAKLRWLMADRHGPLLTVHPLGGCVMADSRDQGVVDDIGRVFDPGASVPDATYPGIAVLDGSVIPTALGTNPALTITAIALRASEGLVPEWGYQSGADTTPASRRRTPFRVVDQGFDSAPTEVGVVERLSGPVRFRAKGDPQPRTRMVELTLTFRPVRLDWLMRTSGDPVAGPNAHPELELDPQRSRMRVLERQQWEQIRLANLPEPELEGSLEAAALLTARLSGRLIVFERQPSLGLWRVIRSSLAWLVNRGARDLWQSWGTPSNPDDPGFCRKAATLIAVASHAGEKRALRYVIGIEDPQGELTLRGVRLVGVKTFTYGLRANPWNQLMEVSLRHFPGLCRLSRTRALTVDLPFFVRRGVPLFQVTRQQNAATGLADLFTFFSYFARLLVGLHLWTFRKPDDVPRREFERLPQNMAGLPPRQVHDIPIGSDVVRLTRYPGPAGGSPVPLLMIHGYSIGGNTFAHHAVQPNAARYFHSHGRDVWIVDLRTSPAFLSASAPWSFEDIAMVDVPLAVKEIVDRTGAPKVDVFAHCMGAAMFSMAVLADGEGLELANDSHVDARDALQQLPGRIRRAALSQVAPLMMMSPANLFRGYVSRYLLDFLPLGGYTFHPDDPDSFGNDLFDRLLASLPYPRDEFTYENPLRFWRRTPWVRTRHRMDVLYGRDFLVRNMPEQVLDHIDDFCGPLNLRTVSQTLHFAELHTIANRRGRNCYVARDRIGRWDFPTFSVHGEDNALADVKTVYRMQDVFAGRLGRAYTHWVEPGAGHLDSLIGTPQARIFGKVRAFFEAADSNVPANPEDGFVAYPPWIGPILSTIERDPQPDRVFVRLGSRPHFNQAMGVVLLPLNPNVPVDVLADMVYVASADLASRNWATVEVPSSLIPNTGGSLLVLVVFPEVRGMTLQHLRDGDYLRVDPLQQHVLSYRLREGTPTRDTIAAVPVEHMAMLSQAVSTALASPALSHLGEAQPDSLPELPDAIDDATCRRIAQAVHDTLERPAPLINDGLVKYDRDARDDRTTEFALGSCQFIPGLIDDPVAGASYARLLQRVRQPPNGGIRPRFVVLAGDQVYTDVRAGLYDPTQQDDRYTTPYVRWLRMRPVRDVFRHLPSVMTLDDHEVDNDWEPIAPGAPMEMVHEAFRTAGVAAYRRYQRPTEPAGTPLWQTAELKGARLFLMDTRTERTRRTATTLELTSASLVDQPQWDALIQWLQKYADDPKFVVSPPMLFPRLLRLAAVNAMGTEALHSDRWDGYPSTLRALIRTLADPAKPIRNLVFLSGDEHRACIATVTVSRNGQPVTTFHSIHTSGNHAPFPSGNALPARFRHAETYQFDDLACVVTASFPGEDDDNGFTYLSLRQAQTGNWYLRVEYDGAIGATLPL
jgi:cholesterol oxidase